MAIGKLDELKGHVKQTAEAVTGDKAVKQAAQAGQTAGKIIKEQAQTAAHKVKTASK